MRREAVAATKADELARAAWPKSDVGLSKKHLIAKGLKQPVALSNGILILTGRNQNGRLYFRGTVDEAMIWLAELPLLAPPIHVDPRADFRAGLNKKLASIAADAATIFKKDRARS